jgi:6-phosphofructokinase 2
MARIATLTMNPAVDVTVEVDRVVPTQKLRCASVRRDAGGGGINVARAIHRLGGDVVAVFPIGRSSGAWLARRMRNEGVPSLTIPIDGDTREDFTAAETSTNQQYRFGLPGPLLTGSDWRACLDAVATLDPAPEFVVASGSLPEGAPDDTYARVARIAAQRGARFALDSHGKALRLALGPNVWLVKPSLGELRELTGEALAGEADQIRVCTALVEAHKARLVALTLGDRGAVLVGEGRILRAPALPIEPLSAIGAGDSFLAGMIWATAAGRDLESAFAYGVAAGSAALLHPGTDLCRAEDVARLVRQVRIETVEAGDAVG